MGILTFFLIAIGLSMDALAVSIASGVTMRGMRFRHAFRMALFFGGFQALMPFLGWLAGMTLKSYITSFDHWVAFGLLAFIGGKMIYESFVIDEAEKDTKCEMRLRTLFVLAIATSIDALAVGVTFGVLKVSIALPVLIIGATTALLSFAGVYAGKAFGKLFENKIEFAGGVILIGIGIKILVEHLLGK
ncbi:MAG: manganese efflux pump [Spirochaetes bacterium]|nr:manganese efflux pump [Spirochaetota bacterium]